MANKIEAKSIAKKVGLPILPGSRDNVLNYLEAKSMLKLLGIQLLLNQLMEVVAEELK